MIRPTHCLALTALLLGGCLPAPDAATNPESAGLRQIALVHDGGDQPPSNIPGECWNRVVTPAVIETRSEHALVQPAVPATDGKPGTPAVYSSETRQKILKDRETVWFRSPCPGQMTPEFIASLQRALKARGYYTGPITGELDAGTKESLRRYQAPRGLDSMELSLGAAQQLGIAEADLYKL